MIAIAREAPPFIEKPPEQDLSGVFTVLVIWGLVFVASVAVVALGEK